MKFKLERVLNSNGSINVSRNWKLAIKNSSNLDDVVCESGVNWGVQTGLTLAEKIDEAIEITGNKPLSSQEFSIALNISNSRFRNLVYRATKANQVKTEKVIGSFIKYSFIHSSVIVNQKIEDMKKCLN